MAHICNTGALPTGTTFSPCSILGCAIWIYYSSKLPTNTKNLGGLGQQPWIS
jgi:hypothetical protein